MKFGNKKAGFFNRLCFLESRLLFNQAVFSSIRSSGCSLFHSRTLFLYFRIFLLKTDSSSNSKIFFKSSSVGGGLKALMLLGTAHLNPLIGSAGFNLMTSIFNDIFPPLFWLFSEQYLLLS